MNHTAQARARPGLAQLHIGRRSTTAVVLQCLCIVERSPGRLDLLSHAAIQRAPSAIGRHDGEPSHTDHAEQCQEQLCIHIFHPVDGVKRRILGTTESTDTHLFE